MILFLANKMQISFREGKPVNLSTANSIALGLAPPVTSKLGYSISKEYVKDILVVTDDEIVETCRILFNNGIKAEPSGCAALAAILFNKVSFESDKKINIVAIITGGNASPKELNNILNWFLFNEFSVFNFKLNKIIKL